MPSPCPWLLSLGRGSKTECPSLATQHQLLSYYQCLYHSNSTDRFQRETASTPCPGSAQAMSVFPFYPAEVPGDSSSTWAAVFVGWTYHMGGDGDAAEGRCSGVCQAPSIRFGVCPCQKIDLNALSSHCLLLFFLPDRLYLVCS